MGELAEAVSVAYRYFVLADDLLPGFSDHLAEHVTLQWFGRSIKGRRNVTNFIMSNRKESSHTFPIIRPTLNITWEELYRRSQQHADVKEVKHDAKYDANGSRGKAFREKSETRPSTIRKNAKSFKQFKRERKNGSVDADVAPRNFDTHESPDEICTNLSMFCDYANDHIEQNRNYMNATVELNDGCYDLNEGDLRNLFEPEITSQTVEEIQNINRIKLKEEMAPTTTAIREHDQEDSSVAETGTIKYLEAMGTISLSRMKMSRDSMSGYYQPRRIKIWKQTCELQIVYSLLTVNKSSKIAEKNDTLGNVHLDHAVVQRDAEEKIKNTQQNMKEKGEDAENNTEEDYDSSSTEKSTQANTPLKSNVNYFDRYLKPTNFFDDRREFIKNFEARMRKEQPNMHSSLRYERNKLIIDYPNKASYHVTYQIHMIIYTKLKKNGDKEEKKEEEEIKEPITKAVPVKTASG